MGPAVVQVMRRYLGAKTGSSFVAKALAFVGLPVPSPWCLASVLFCSFLALAPGERFPYPKIARCSVFWARVTHDRLHFQTFTPRDVAWGLASPEAGDIAIFSHNPDEVNWNGHAALVVESVDASTIRTIEGNTSSNEKGDQRNGGTVAEKVRHSGVHSFLLMGFVRPRR